MNDYIKGNKAAWEEAFSEANESFINNTIERLKTNPKALFTTRLWHHLTQDAKQAQTLVHLCCNNGRETMGAIAAGYKETVGFDIAQNMVDFANNTAKTLSINSTFYERNILEIEPSFYGKYDTVLFTVGAITWFEDLNSLFSVAFKLLKPHGTLIIEDFHPFGNMIPAKGEEGYSEESPSTPYFNYFKDTPWVELIGMGYMSNKEKSTHAFTSYSHTFSSLLNATKNAGFTFEHIEESDVCIANLLPHLNHQGLPLSYRLITKK